MSVTGATVGFNILHFYQSGTAASQHGLSSPSSESHCTGELKACLYWSTLVPSSKVRLMWRFSDAKKKYKKLKVVKTQKNKVKTGGISEKMRQSCLNTEGPWTQQPGVCPSQFRESVGWFDGLWDARNVKGSSSVLPSFSKLSCKTSLQAFLMGCCCSQSCRFKQTSTFFVGSSRPSVHQTASLKPPPVWVKQWKSDTLADLCNEGKIPN